MNPNKKRATRAKNFVITVNNPDAKVIESLKAMELISYGVIGKEVGESGTPHLQGYVQLNERKTITGFQKALVAAGIRSWIGIAKGSVEENQKYCKKDGDWVEWGTPITKGKRTDIDALYKLALEQKTDEEIGSIYPGGLLKYYKAIEHVRAGAREKQGKAELKAEYEGCELRPWQQTALNALREQTNRQIYWIVDPKGNTGKSWFAGWLQTHCDAIVYDSGKKADIAYAYNYEPIVVFDYTREKQEFMKYGTIESFKNGRIFSPKYASRTKIFKSPAVLVLSNWEPDKSKLSDDRWVIVRLVSL